MQFGGTGRATGERAFPQPLIDRVGVHTGQHTLGVASFAEIGNSAPSTRDSVVATAERGLVAESLRRFAPGTPMMETTQAWVGNHDRVRRRLVLDRPAVWRVLLQGIVNPFLMVVPHVIADRRVEGEHELEHKRTPVT